MAQYLSPRREWSGWGCYLGFELGDGGVDVELTAVYMRRLKPVHGAIIEVITGSYRVTEELIFKLTQPVERGVSSTKTLCVRLPVAE
ncbi:MAG: hypothetical protein IPJ90_08250 [Anaerolineaceae bacterium]|nr:hypothetical protein [Anaerolineaceae bacterium]